ncbi:MAG: glycosyltransferase family 39 protein [Anaerolineaceae bacterium]|nr:glycosyltransferase family 39 protein [Anaerolineaceae bacterium]
MSPRRTTVILSLILLLAFGLRLVNLGGRSLWYDEAFAVLFAEKGMDAMLYGTLTPVAGGAADIHPLLYYVTLNAWMNVFGDDPFTVRLWSAVLGVATVGVLYLIGRDLFESKTGLVAAFITAIAPFHVQYSQEIRMYALLGLLLALATWCFVRGMETPPHITPDVGAHGGAPARKRITYYGWWLAFGVLAGLAMYTQQLAVFYLAALAFVPVWRRDGALLRRVALGTGVALLVYLPWLVNLPGQFAKVRSYYWLSPPSPARPLLTARSFLSVNLDIPAPGSLIAFLGAVFIVLFLALQVILYARRHGRRERAPLFFVLWLAGGPVALMWLVSQVQPVYLERALLPSALMLYLALAWLFTRGGLPRPISAVIAGVGLLLVGIGLVNQYTWDTFPNSPFPAAVDYIRDHWQAGDVVVHQNKLTALPMIYYGRDLEQRYLADKPGSSEDTLALPTQESLNLLADATMAEVVGDARRVWWVSFTFAETQYGRAGRPEYQDAVDWLVATFDSDMPQVWNDLAVTLETRQGG